MNSTETYSTVYDGRVSQVERYLYRKTTIPLESCHILPDVSKKRSAAIFKIMNELTDS